MQVVEDDRGVALVLRVVPAPPFGKTLLEGPGVLIVDEGRLPCPRSIFDSLGGAFWYLAAILLMVE